MEGIVTVLNGLKVNSITYDNGLEFAMHERVNELLECDSYFCGRGFFSVNLLE
jgi:IS30 family transposase